MKMGKHEEPKDKQISSHLALLLYICLWRWKLAAPEQLSAWTIGTDHVIITERIFSSWVAYNLSAQIAGGFPSLYEWERAPPVRPVLCEQNWMLSLSPRYHKCALCSPSRHFNVDSPVNQRQVPWLNQRWIMFRFCKLDQRWYCDVVSLWNHDVVSPLKSWRCFTVLPSALVN